MEERDFFASRSNHLPTLNKEAWNDTGTYWQRFLASSDVMHVCTSALSLGYSFQDECSRDALQKCPSGQMSSGSMVIMVKK